MLENSLWKHIRNSYSDRQMF